MISHVVVVITARPCRHTADLSTGTRVESDGETFFFVRCPLCGAELKQKVGLCRALISIRP